MKRTLKDLRLGYGLTQEDLAKVLNICPVQYSRKERGKNPFTIEEYRTLYKYFCNFNKLDAGKFFLEA